MTVTTVTFVTQTVEYVLRVRMQEPPDDPAVSEESRIGEQMADLFLAIEAAAVDQEIVSRAVLPGPGSPSRVRCRARSLDPTRHYAASRRWQITTPSGETIVTCSAACALSWLCREALPADAQERRQNRAGTAPGGPESETATCC